MSPTLLTTKLFVPPQRQGRVPRARLTDRLGEGLTRKLTLISAPAGSGKTTLMSDFVRLIGRPVAWVSLDSGDNDPTRFLSYTLAALQNVEPEIGRTLEALLRSPQPPLFEKAVASTSSVVRRGVQGTRQVWGDIQARFADPDGNVFLLVEGED